MRALDRKLLRDLWQMRGQALAICAVMGCGVAMLVMSLSTVSALQTARSTYYERYRFADVFAHVKRAPLSLAERIVEIPGVARVQTRVVIDVTLDIPGLAEPASGRLISIPERQTPGLNDLHLRGGRYIQPGRGAEVLVSEAFAEANKFQPGDRVTAVINGRKRQLEIVGIVLSPEFIYSLRPGELLPDDRRFGVFWMGTTELSAAYNMEGAFNDISLALMPGASEPEVLRRLDLITAPYGGLGAYGRDDQLSHKLVGGEMDQLRSMALLPPAIFLGVAAFLLNVVLNRQIATQREQIAALKAFGYSRMEIGLHYLKLVLLLVAAGCLVGTVAGAWLGRGLTALYSQFFRFPSFDYHLELSIPLIGIGVSGTAAILGTLGAVRRAMRLPPAEAMRPEPPATYRPTFVERLGLQAWLSASSRMILRHLERRPIKALLSSLGISLAVSVLILGNFVVDIVDFVIEQMFFVSQRQDVTITLVEPTSGRALHDLEHLPGVLRAEPFRGVPIRMRSGPMSRRLAILGLGEERELYRLLDADGQEVPLPTEGLVISEKLAEILQVRVGDTVTVEVLEGERSERQAVIAGLVRDYAGLQAYMDIRALQRLMREGSAITGAYLAVDPQYLDDFYAEIKDTPRVAGVTVKMAALRSFEDTMAENLLRMKMFNVIFASIIACGVVYNSARIALAERSRELASLRVLGFTRGEISYILLGELAVLSLMALPFGMLFGYGLAIISVKGLETEAQRFPLVIYSSTYAFAVTVVLLASLVSGLLVRRRLDHLDLVAVLKAKE